MVVTGIEERFVACDPCMLRLPAVVACILEGESLCEWGVNSSSEGRAYGTYCGKGKDGGELGDGLRRPPDIIKDGPAELKRGLLRLVPLGIICCG